MCGKSESEVRKDAFRRKNCYHNCDNSSSYRNFKNTDEYN
nr:MAG TPA: hypothetical protein [Caudoviricetes sp.]